MEKWLPLVGVLVGWGLKSISDYVSQRMQDLRLNRVATFYVLRAYKSVFDYERATRYFREEHPTVDEFEPWRAILHERLRGSLQVNSQTTSKAVETLAAVDPPLATQMDNTIKNLLFMLEKDFNSLSKSDPQTYAALIHNQDKLLDVTLADFRKVALRLAAKSGVGQVSNVTRWFSAREIGTKDFMKSMREQQNLLQKVIEP